MPRSSKPGRFQRLGLPLALLFLPFVVGGLFGLAANVLYGAIDPMIEFAAGMCVGGLFAVVFGMRITTAFSEDNNRLATGMLIAVFAIEVLAIPVATLLHLLHEASLLSVIEL